MDTAKTTIHDLEAVETRQGAVPRAAPTWRGCEPGRANGREQSRSMEDSRQSCAALYASKRLLRQAWSSKVVHWSLAQSVRTAGCGSACPVEWEGRGREAPPIPIEWHPRPSSHFPSGPRSAAARQRTFLIPIIDHGSSRHSLPRCRQVGLWLPLHQDCELLPMREIIQEQVAVRVEEAGGEGQWKPE